MKKLLPLFISAAIGGLSTNVFADTLTEIYNQAKENDPTLLNAAAKRDAAFEAITSTRAVLLPQIQLTAGYDINQSNIDGRDSNKTTAGIGFTQELYNRASWVNLDTAEKRARSLDASYAAAQQDLILRVTSAYFGVLSAKDNLTFVQAEKAAVGRQLEQTKQRFEVGLSAITDVHEAQAEYDTVLAEEVAAQNTLVNSYEDLREITGQDHSQLDTLDTARFSASKSDTDLNTLVQQAEKENLSLLSARIAKDIAKDEISRANSGHLPTLSLKGGYGFSKESNDNNPSYALKDAEDISVGINLAIPVYSGGATSSLTKQAEFNYVAASQDLEATYRSVVKNVRAFNNDISSSIGIIKAYNQTVISAESAKEATEAGFEVGTRTIVDVLDSTRRLYDANKNLSSARYDYILNQLKLRQAVGTLNEQDVLDINAGLKASK